MATKSNKVVTYRQELRAKESHKPLNMWSHVTDQKHYISTITMPIATKPGRKVSCREGLSDIKLHHHLNKYLLGVIWEIRYISNCWRPMHTKLYKVMTYHKRLPLIKSHNPLIIWPRWGHMTDWKSLLSQNVWPLNLAGWWLQGGGSEHKCLSRH